MWDKGCCTMEGDYCESAIPCSECALWQSCATCKMKDECFGSKWLFVTTPEVEE